MKIWIFQTGEPLPSDGADARPMRAMNLASALVQKGHHVVLWSSSFYHQEKRHRSRHYKKIQLSEQLEVRLIPSCGYDRNIGPGRLLDHAQLALNLKKALSKEKTVPDAAFVGYPPIEFAYVATKWLKERKIPSLLDAKDQWPQIFVDPFPPKLQPLAKLLLFPYFYLGRQSMRQATALCSMAEGFLAWMRDYSNRPESPLDAVFPLVARYQPISSDAILSAREFWFKKNVDLENHHRFIYAGSVTPTLELETIKKAAELIRQRGISYQFVICGNGSAYEEAQRLFSEDEGFVLPGWVDRPQLSVLAAASIGSLVPYKNNDAFYRSIPNKIFDSLALGLPLISSLRGEVEKLIENYQVGVTYMEGSPESLANACMFLLENRERQKEMSVKGIALFSKEYLYDSVYGRLVEQLEKLVKSHGN